MLNSEAKVKRIIPLMIVGALFAVGCSEKKPATAPTTPNELTAQPLPPMAPGVNTLTPIEPSAPTAVTPPPAAKAVTPKVAHKPEVKHTAKASAKTSGKMYTIKKGDTLAVIAKAHKTTVKKIVAVNPGLNPDRIIIGHKIHLP